MIKNKGFTLIELMIVILIVAILAAVAIPIMRGRMDAAKWSEGKASLGSIATAIRAYHGEKGIAGALPTAIVGTGATELGFLAADLTGTYFTNTAYTMAVTSMDPLTFTVTCTAASSGLPASGETTPTNPAAYNLNQDGFWF